MEYQEIITLMLLVSTIIFLLATAILAATRKALRQIQKRETKKNLNSLGRLFFYRKIHLYFFPHQEFESLFLATTFTLIILRFCYAVCFMLFLLHSQSLTSFALGIIIFLFVLTVFSVTELIPRTIGTRLPHQTLRFCGPIASLFMLITFPLNYLIIKISLKYTRAAYFHDWQEPETKTKQEIMDIIQEAKVSPGLDPHDKKLIESVVSFRDRIAREVMVPRVNVFSLAAETSIREATHLLQAEGYSRTPVYRQNVDNIIGVLMYKDILNKYIECERHKKPQILDAPIETIIKNVLYTPETKKISLLLQEFRKKQVHLAIVVDEYGGTEGIVTIEDILEEIVGEIADEYDEKEALYLALPDGRWLVDARMNILDAEEILGIQIPQEGDYDTIGGYIFHRTGSIPPRGVVIHHDTFDLEIFSSNDRAVEKVRIKPIVNSPKFD